MTWVNDTILIYNKFDVEYSKFISVIFDSEMKSIISTLPSGNIAASEKYIACTDLSRASKLRRGYASRFVNDYEHQDINNNIDYLNNINDLSNLVNSNLIIINEQLIDENILLNTSNNIKIIVKYI